MDISCDYLYVYVDVIRRRLRDTFFVDVDDLYSSFAEFGGISTFRAET